MAVISYGDQILEQREALDILQQLTSRGRTAWISAGTIQATHVAYKAPVTTDSDEIESQIQQEIKEFEANPSKLYPTEEMQKLYLEAIPFNVRYKLANESTTISDVRVKYDGERFYWEIEVTSRDDSVQPSADVADNCLNNSFNMAWNERRIFAWDGKQYTIYSTSANYATVDADDRLPRTVRGPLTAGFVAWGTGDLTFDDLKNAEISAAEVDRDGTTQVEMKLEGTNGTSYEFHLDAAKDYVVTHCVVTRPDNTTTTAYYSDYLESGGDWIPSSILIEKHDSFTGRLLTSDKWEITAIDSKRPTSDEFKIEYYNDAVVEYCSSLTDRTSIYRFSTAVDTDAILAEHLTYAAKRGKQKQNCATVALKYTAEHLGKIVSDSKLAELIDAQGRTNLYELKQYAEELGLHCQALKADPAVLKDLSNCQVILHLPGKDHFVVLERVDEKQAWIVDLSDESFYYSQDIASVPTLWPSGTALILSDKPIPTHALAITDTSLTNMTGATNYSCTELIQEELGIACPMDCVGEFWWFWERFGCEEAPEGTCTWQWLSRCMTTDCYLEISGRCGPTEWEYYYIYACK